MKSVRYSMAIAFAAGALFVAPTSSATVIGISSADLDAQIAIDFENLGLCGDFLSACAVDDLLDLNGATIGERFAGQTLGSTSGFVGPHDTLTQDPTNPLTVVAGLSGRNLAYQQGTGVNGWGIAGLGREGIGISGNGEGAVSILFDTDLSGFGLTIGGGDNSGSVIFDFFSRDGTFINRILRGGGSGDPFSVAFAADGDVLEIAGVSITNIELNGVVFDNFRLRTVGNEIDDGDDDDDAVSVPEPGTLALFGLGLLGMGLARRRHHN